MRFMKIRASTIIVSIIAMSMVATANPETIKDWHHQIGISPVIAKNLSDGIPVDNIVRNALLWKGMSGSQIIYNLFCFNVDVDVIRRVAKSNGISECDYERGLKKSLFECPIQP